MSLTRSTMFSALCTFFTLMLIPAVLGEGETCVCLQKVATNLRNPIHLEFREEGFYLAEQRGVVLFYGNEDNEESEARIMLNISGKVFKSDNPFSEQGLLGFALHPRYAENGRFYVFYMDESQTGKFSILSEFTSTDGYAGPDTERFILRIEKPSHAGNGGQLLFGHDGYLYVSVGDGVGDVGNTPNSAQNLTSLLGKILRIDVDSQSFSEDSALSYGIPPSNPFYNQSSWRREVFAYGCRDMFRCSQDTQPDQKGEYRIFCGDPGARDYEEIDIIKAGRNYGWDIKEGFNCYDSSRCSKTLLDNEELPVHVYKHTQLHHAVVGGHVYRGSGLPFLTGQYVFGDALDRSLSTLKEEGVNWTSAQLPVCDQAHCSCEARERLQPFLLAFSQDQTGEIYILATKTLTANIDDGVVLKIVPGQSDKMTCDAPSLLHGSTPFLSLFVGMVISRFVQSCMT